VVNLLFFCAAYFVAVSTVKVGSGEQLAVIATVLPAGASEDLLLVAAADQTFAQFAIDLVEFFALEHLMRAKYFNAGGGFDSVHLFAFGWTLVNVAFKQTLSVIISDRGEEAEYGDYLNALEAVCRLVRNLFYAVRPAGRLRAGQRSEQARAEGVEEIRVDCFRR